MKKIVVVSLVTALVLAGAAFVPLQQGFLVYPLWANKVTYSLSMREVTIDLSTGKVEEGVFKPTPSGEKRRVAELEIPRAYISWKPYLKGEPVNSVHIEAALPDLIPNVIWKKDYLDSVLAEKGTVSFEDEKVAHQHLVRIEIGLYGFSNSMCESACSRREHNNRVLNSYLKRYDKPASVDQSLGLRKYVSTADSIAVADRELYITLEHVVDHHIVECHSPAGHFQWCTARTILNEDMYLSYKFERTHLENWRAIDESVRDLVNGLVTSHATRT